MVIKKIYGIEEWILQFGSCHRVSLKDYPLEGGGGGGGELARNYLIVVSSVFGKDQRPVQKLIFKLANYNTQPTYQLPAIYELYLTHVINTVAKYHIKNEITYVTFDKL